MKNQNKYLRHINSSHDRLGVTVDVYEVLEAFNVTCPARQHAIKKLLCSGLRGKGSVSQDLIEAGQAVSRAIEMQSTKDEESV